MLEEGLENDHIVANTTIYCVIQQQVDNQKFIHESMTTMDIFWNYTNKVF